VGEASEDCSEVDAEVWEQDPEEEKPMSEEGVEVKLYLDHVKVTVEKATEKVLRQLAFRITERAQMNIRTNDQIDTGFMVNSIYPVWKDGSGYEAARSEAEGHTVSGRTGERVDHSGDMAPEEALEAEAMAGVVVGANYAIYQENIKPFLYPGAEKAAAEFGGEAERIYRELLPEEGPKA
jgi:hypothetical protein